MSLLKAEGAAADEDEEVLLQSWGGRKSDVKQSQPWVSSPVVVSP